MESSPLKSLAVSHLPDPPTRPLFQATENPGFSMMIIRIEEENCPQNDPQKAGTEFSCITV